MPLYETTFIARQDLSSSDVERLTTKFSTIINDLGGKIIRSEYWGLRNLAYIINKNKKGHYIFLGVEAPFAAIKELQRNLKLSEDVLRNLVVKVETLDDKPSVILREEDEEENKNEG